MAAMVVALMGSAVWLTVATAVHDEGIFQLDGNAQTSVQSPVPATEDWDKICNADPDCDLVAGYPDPGGTTSDDFQFVTELDPDSILTGGSTKDDLDIPGWRWKTASPSPDKNDLTHAFAAKYTKANGAGAADDEKLIYFGADRFSNAGNANIAFWFFQNQVGASDTDAPTTDGECDAPGCPFSGTHVAHAGTCPGATCVRGDILVVSAFTNGGTQPNIAVYEWYGKGLAPAALCANNECSLAVLISEAQGAPCASASANDNACAIVNPVETGGTISPWEYQEKSTKDFAANRFGDGDFFEGGLNLTGLGYGDVCISSFLVNTRSSQSVDSVLHDFALGDLGGCTSTTVTTPKDGSGAAIPAYNPAGTNPATNGGLLMEADGTLDVKDTAAVTVTGISTWSGTVQFFLCGPLPVASTCTTGGVPIGSAVAYNQGTATPPGVTSIAASVTEANTFASGNTGAPSNHYCWRAVFTATSPVDLPGSSDSSSTECFVVKPRQSTLDTLAGAGPVALGSAVTDTATLGNTANQEGNNGGVAGTYLSINATNGAAANGTITFKLYGPHDGSLTAAECTALSLATGFPAAGISRTVSGNGTYGDGVPAADAVVTFTPASPGFYTWRAEYSGDLPNTLASAHNADCSDTDEQVEVLQLQPTITTAQRFLPNDKATVSVVSGAGNLAGTVKFELFLNSSACGGGVDYTEDIVVSGASPQETVYTSNTTQFVDSTQSVSWQVTYTSTNAGHKNIAATCHENTLLTIDNNTDSLHPAP